MKTTNEGFSRQQIQRATKKRVRWAAPRSDSWDPSTSARGRAGEDSLGRAGPREALEKRLLAAVRGTGRARMARETQHGQFWKMEEEIVGASSRVGARNLVSPRAASKEQRPADPLVVAWWDLCWDPAPQTGRRIH